MDSDDESVFSLGDESDGYAPQPKKTAAVKTTAAKKTAAPKKMVQSTLKTKPVPKKRAKPQSDDESDGAANDSGFSNTPPSSKKQKKNPPPKKSSGVALAEVENESVVEAPANSKKKSATETYQKLTQLEHIIKRPDTYIGSVEKTEQPMWTFSKATGEMEYRTISFVPGFYKIFDEILVNAADNNERKEEKMTYMKVTIDRENGEISVENNGKGIPVVIHEKEKIYIPELIFGHLLAGSNFDDDEKKTVGGRNGYGAKLCNVFSTEFTIEVQDHENGKRYKQTWTNNMQNMGKAKISSNKTGNFVRITFKPDFQRFGMPEGIDDEIEGLMVRRVYDMAGTAHGIKVYLNGEQLKIKDFKAYCNLYAKSIAKERSMEEGGAPNTTVEIDKGNARWEVGFTVSDGTFQQVSFVNSIATTSGGTHVNYIVDQVTNHLLKTLDKRKKGHGLKQSHLKNHVFIFVRCSIENPAFTSQTKEQMTTKVSQFGSKYTLSEEFLKKIAKSEAIENLISFADRKADKMLAKSDGNKRSRVSNAKLVEANYAGTKRGRECILILTEGDSAKGLAVSGRAILDPDRIGVFPLRGKLLNVRDASLDQITKNQEIQNIKQILGLKHKQVYTSVDSLRYGHIMIMTDQDHDGSHIKGLLINFLQVQFPSLLQIPGFLQEFITPIVKVWQGKDPKKPTKALSFFTQPEYEEWKQAHERELSRWQSKYYKGLGTSSAEDAQVYFKKIDEHLKTFDTMKPEEASLFELAFSKKKADARKEWLGNFVPGTFLDHTTKTIAYDNFVNQELILFSMADNMRSIPSVLDGLKPGQRKVVYACFKRNLVKDKKVAELAGYVSEQTSYHHGEVSLQMTITNLAQNFIGSNNVNILEPSGNFGSRLAGGSDAASARYIFTRLSPFARKIFSPLDEPNLKHQYEEGNRIEPEVYAPVIPMVLINGADGIGTGWSTNIPNYHPSAIVENLKRRMGRLVEGDFEEKPFETMMPWFRGWKGTPEAAGPDRYKFNGIASQSDSNPNEIIITELPIRMWTDDFKARLEKIISGADGPSWIKDYKEFNDHKTVHFEIMVDEKHMPKVLEEGILERFKLQKQVATSNLVAFDTRGQIRRYEKVEDILEEYYQYRLGMYTERKKYWLGLYHDEYRKLKNQARFIKEIIDGDLVVGRKRKDVLVQELRERKYEAFPRNADQSKKKDENAASGDEEDEVESAGSAGDYDYLLSMPIWSLTAERLEKLKDAIAKKKAEHDELSAKSEKDLWCADLDEFMIEWENQLAIDAEIQTNIRRMGRRASKKLGVGRGRKAKGDDDYAPEKKTKAKAKAAPKVETKSAQRFAEMFSAKPKPKKEPEDDPVQLSDNFSDDDFAALSRSKPAAVKVERAASQKPEEATNGRGKRAAASKARAFFDNDSDSDGDDDDKMLGDVGALVKGITKSSEEPSGRLSLYAMNRPDSSSGAVGNTSTNGLPKLKTKASAKSFDLDSPDDTNYEMLAKSSPHKPPPKADDIDEFLSDDEPVVPAEKPAVKASLIASSKAPAGLATVKKSRGRPAGSKNKAKEKEPVKATKAAAKQTTLSPAAKAYATKKAVKKVVEPDSDEEMADPDSPPPKPASRRPGRAAAARRPIVIDDEDSSIALDDKDDDSDDPFGPDDDDD
ncbi:DNA topoisomerase [Stachybotrys elegans]|uniref:DNA topoisomerase 2 n=1 Tax=Stachybotrys elegans TaxID=80388 RepID=A0A8K0T4Z0_9HYPO|nr:DNA topoisomerase [Stachybotrys elegans]